MKPQARHQDRSAVAVVAGIVYVLQVESGVDTPPDVDAVSHLVGSAVCGMWVMDWRLVQTITIPD